MYDIQSVNWRAVKQALDALPEHDHQVDWCDGSHFPWWVWLANTGVWRDVVNEGVISVEVEVAKGSKCVIVRSLLGESRLSANPRTGKMETASGALQPAARAM